MSFDDEQRKIIDRCKEESEKLDRFTRKFRRGFDDRSSKLEHRVTGRTMFRLNELRTKYHMPLLDTKAFRDVDDIYPDPLILKLYPEAVGDPLLEELFPGLVSGTKESSKGEDK